MSKSDDHPFRYRLLSGFAAALLVAGCATTPDPPPPASAVAPPPQAAPARASQPPRTASAPVPLNPRHPERYVVKKGDTLWDISAMFLRDPWFWPEIWYANPQVENPHLIFPGDVLTLVYVDGRPRIVLERGEIAGVGAERLQPRVRVEHLEEAIFTIPYDRIAAFLSRPSVLDRETADRAPYVLTDRRGHLVHGAQTEVYVRGRDFADDDIFSIMHVGSPLRDPESGRLLGFHGIYAGEGRIVRTGDPATMYLNSTTREVLNGDRLLPVRTDFPLRFVPRAPEQAVEGQIIDALDAVSLLGSYQIVTLNRGARHGLEPGHVLSVWQGGRRVSDRFGGGRAQLPDEYGGVLMIFQTYDEVSFGLIMQAANEIRVLDRVRNP